MDAVIAVTYRCNAHCRLCGIWQHPTRPEEEVGADDLGRLPKLKNVNITGGEPFLRSDIADIVEVLRTRADRVIVSTNGYFTERISDLAERFPDLGFRVSVEGLPAVHDDLRGLKGSFERALRSVVRLRSIGLEDVGIGMTVSDHNADEVLELYELASSMGIEFDTAVVHNGHHVHRSDNGIARTERVASDFEELARRMLETNRPDKWFRAWFNAGLAYHVRGGRRLLQCGMARETFFVHPCGAIMPCESLDVSMGSLKSSGFRDIWDGEEATRAREQVRECRTRCWMMGSVGPMMRKHAYMPTTWVAKAKMSRDLPSVGRSGSGSVGR